MFHLREAREEVERIICEIEANLDFGEIEFEISMAHAYNHLNTAWNSRNVDPERLANCSESEFYTWRDFPSDISMGR